MMKSHGAIRTLQRYPTRPLLFRSVIKFASYIIFRDFIVNGDFCSIFAIYCGSGKSIDLLRTFELFLYKFTKSLW